MRIVNPRYLFLIGLLLMSVLSQVAAQLEPPRFNSPYSRFGIGELVNTTHSAAVGMGNLTAAWHHEQQANLDNPAALGHLRATAFEVQAFMQRSQLSQGDRESDYLNGNLSGLTLAFPLRNPINAALEKQRYDLQWGMSFGLKPYSQTGYQVEGRTFVADFDTIANIFNGSGSTYVLSWGNGFNYKQFSFGFEMGYLFGRQNLTQRTQFVDLGFSQQNLFVEELGIGAFVWKLGGQYQYDFNELVDEKGEPRGRRVGDRSLTVGIFGNTNMGATTRTESDKIAIDTRTNVTDTLSVVEITGADATLPANLTIGFMYENFKRLRIGVEWERTMWSNYENTLRAANLGDVNMFKAGVEFIPKANSYRSYLQRISYRIGAYTGDDPRIVNNQLTRSAITFGLGLPIILPRQQTSFVNLGFEIGNQSVDGGIDERFARVSIGFTLNDNSWFYKRKFN